MSERIVMNRDDGERQRLQRQPVVVVVVVAVVVVAVVGNLRDRPKQQQKAN